MLLYDVFSYYNLYAQYQPVNSNILSYVKHIVLTHILFLFIYFMGFILTPTFFYIRFPSFLMPACELYIRTQSKLFTNVTLFVCVFSIIIFSIFFCKVILLVLLPSLNISLLFLLSFFFSLF